MNVYPSFEELTPGIVKAVLPVSLYYELDERYTTLGEKYLTTAIHSDGRRINGCMYKSSVQDAIEEVTDAIFNMLVLMFKENKGMGESESGAVILRTLIEVYTLLAVERELEDASTER